MKDSHTYPRGGDDWHRFKADLFRLASDRLIERGDYVGATTAEAQRDWHISQLTNQNERIEP